MPNDRPGGNGAQVLVAGSSGETGTRSNAQASVPSATRRATRRPGTGLKSAPVGPTITRSPARVGLVRSPSAKSGRPTLLRQMSSPVVASSATTTGASGKEATTTPSPSAFGTTTGLPRGA